MILGIISDTHDKLESVERALEYFAANHVEMVIHCGDWKSVVAMEHFVDHAGRHKMPVRGVLGNNDIDVSEFKKFIKSTSSDFQVVEGIFEMDIDGKSVAIYHGHHIPTLRKVRNDCSYNLVLLGHTHKPKVEINDTTVIVNPGSTAFSIPRSKQWQATVALVDTDSIQASLHTV